MFIDNRKYGLFESSNNFSQMGPGYAQFFRLFCFLIVICLFPLSITGAMSTIRNLNGSDCFPIEKMKDLEKEFEKAKVKKEQLKTRREHVERSLELVASHADPQTASNLKNLQKKSVKIGLIYSFFYFSFFMACCEIICLYLLIYFKSGDSKKPFQAWKKPKIDKGYLKEREE